MLELEGQPRNVDIYQNQKPRNVDMLELEGQPGTVDMLVLKAPPRSDDMLQLENRTKPF